MKYTGSCTANRTLAGMTIGTLGLGFGPGTVIGGAIGSVSCENGRISQKLIGGLKNMVTPSNYVR